MTIEEAVQEIKDHIDTQLDAQKIDMLSKMNTKFEVVKNFLHNAIKEGSIIIERPDRKLVVQKKRYQT